jgi:hypothetical protein
MEKTVRGGTLQSVAHCYSNSDGRPNELGIASPIRRGNWKRQEGLEAHKTIKSENLQVYLVVDGRIILKSKLKEWEMKTWTGFIKLRIWPMGGPNENRRALYKLG